MFRSLTFLPGVAVLCGALFLSAAATQAAVIIGTFTNNVAGNQDFTNFYGTSDWIYYDNNSGSTIGTPANPTNQKSGVNLISSAFAVGGGSLRTTNSTNLPLYDFSYTDGTSPTSGVAVDAAGVFNTGLNLFGRGVGVTVTIPTLDTYRLSVFVSGFDVNGRFSAQLSGATTYESIAYTTGSSRPGALYELLVTPDMAGDVLTINFTQNSGTSDSAHTMISGVGISLVPEPTTAVLLLGVGAVGVMSRRRRGPQHS